MDQTSQEPGYSIAIGAPPFSPWLRLAHLWRVAPAHATTTCRLRRLRDFEFFLQVEGATWLAVPSAGGRVPLPEGSLALIPPGLVHAWGHLAGAHVAVHFDLHARPGLESPDMVERAEGDAGSPSPRPGWRWRLGLGVESIDLPLAILLPDPEAWRRRFAPLVDWYAARRHRGAEARLAAAGIIAAALADFIALARGTGSDPLLTLLAQAAARPAGGAPIAQLARRAGLGETAFRAAVLRATGLPPRAYLERLRLERAAYALRSGREPIARIAAAAGYGDAFHFSRAFRRVIGVSPRAWRNG